MGRHLMPGQGIFRQRVSPATTGKVIGIGCQVLIDLEPKHLFLHLRVRVSTIPAAVAGGASAGESAAWTKTPGAF